MDSLLLHHKQNLNPIVSDLWVKGKYSFASVEAANTKIRDFSSETI